MNGESGTQGDKERRVKSYDCEKGARGARI